MICLAKSFHRNFFLIHVLGLTKSFSYLVCNSINFKMASFDHIWRLEIEFDSLSRTAEDGPRELFEGSSGKKFKIPSYLYMYRVTFIRYIILTIFIMIAAIHCARMDLLNNCAKIVGIYSLLKWNNTRLSLCS